MQRFLHAFLCTILAIGCSSRTAAPTADRTAYLQQAVTDQQAASEAELASYAPREPKPIADLSVDAVAILRGLPGVAEVEVLVAAEKPTHRLVHLSDWHYVPREMFAADTRAAGRNLNDAQMEAAYREHLLEVELVQIEQLALLRCLIRHHGLRQILAEGLTPTGVTAYQEIVAAFRASDRRLKVIQSQATSLKQKPASLQRQIDESVREHRRNLLEFGAAAQLAVADEIVVLPLDDDATLEAAKPVAPSGALRADPAKRQAREDAQVQAALKSGSLSFLILGGDHDLSDSVRRLGGGTTEYLRITTSQYIEVAHAN